MPAKASWVQHRAALTAVALAISAWALQRWLAARRRALAQAARPHWVSRKKALAADPDAYRADARVRRRARKALRKEALWREASERAAVDQGVKLRTRALEVGGDVSVHNAWDSIPWDLELEARTQSDARAQPTAADSAVRAVCTQSDAMWDAFYQENLLAYKHRRYLHSDFPELAEIAAQPSGQADGKAAEGALVLEIGCGPGNAALPLLAQYPRLRICASDISPTAVRLLTAHPSFPADRCSACVWDVADARGLPASVAEGSADAALLIFVLSALPPDAFARAAGNVFRALKPGGVLLFRDYGLSDEKQRKFTKGGTKLGEGWYARQNGTMVYFFDTAEVDALFASSGFEPIAHGRPAAPAADGASSAAGVASGGAARFDKLLTVNRKTDDRLWRVWVTGRYRKPHAAGARLSAADGSSDQ